MKYNYAVSCGGRSSYSLHSQVSRERALSLVKRLSAKKIERNGWGFDIRLTTCPTEVVHAKNRGALRCSSV